MSALDAAAKEPSAGSFFTAGLVEADPELAAAIKCELHRQQDQIELIASENIVSRAVLEAQGSVLTNKYAEGYPGRRYYGGCEHVDVVETLAIERAKRSSAASSSTCSPIRAPRPTSACCSALCKPGDTIMGCRCLPAGT